MRYCQEKGIMCQYAGTNMHCRLSACILPKESLYPTASDYEHKAATALSTLQIENQALRNAASGFKAENEKLREMYQKDKAVCHATQAKLDQMKRENETLKHALQNWHEED